MEDIDIENRYQMLFENMINGFAFFEMLLDKNKKPTNCICLEINSAFERITGIKAEMIVGVEMNRILDAAGIDHEAFIEKFTSVALHGEHLELEHHYEKDNRYFSIHAFSLEKNRFAAIIMDVTDRVIIRKQMEKRDWQLKTILNHSNEVFYIHDTQGNMDFVSDLSTNIYGHSLEILRDRWEKIATDNPMNFVGREKTKLALETGVKQDPYLLEIKDSNGELKYVEINESPMFNSSGEVIGISGAIRNQTDSVIAERERKLLQNQLLQSQKMEAVGRLAGGVAHDFNNLMTVVTGYCDILRTKVKGRDDILEDIEEISNAGTRASQLTRQLLAFSRKQVLDLEVFNIADEVSNTRNMLRRLIGEDVKLNVICKGEDLIVRADRGQIQQILINLAVNSRDAMPDGGEITIEISSIFIDEAFQRTHSCTVCGTFVLITFSDTGVGMSEEIKSKVFEPFFTTKELGKGTGLGLSTVYGIVKQLQGGIDVYSKPEHGTVFKIYLPFVQGEEELIQESVHNLPECGNITVLLAEDDHEVSEVVKAMLESSGLRVLEASGGKMAIELYKANSSEIDLLLTDVVMPGMGGVELAEEVRKFNSSAKVLFMSGYTDNAIQYKDVIRDGFALIRKPFDINALKTRICGLMRDKSV